MLHCLMIFRPVKAYSLIELVVVLTILSMISMMTLPNYQQWIKRFRYWEILQEVQVVKLQVEWCYWQHGSIDPCSSPSNGLDYVADKTSLIDSIEVEEGVVHVIPKNKKGMIAEDDLWMHPVNRKNRLIWQYSGGAVRKGYVRS